MKNRQAKYNLLLGGASAIALSLSAPVYAQDAEDTSSDEESRRLNTVQVTATRREGTTVQDVPIAVTALDPETLDRAGIADIRNLDTVSSSFNMNTSDTNTGGATIRLRGVGTTGNNIGLESSVGVFLDGVYLSRPGVALADLVDIAQVEVLRGPQGTLFGRNTSAGALNISTKKPEFDEASGYANLTLGNFDLFNLQGGFNLPVSDDLAVRVSGAVRQRGGFITQDFGGNDTSTVDRISGRLQALYDGGTAGEVRLIVDYAEGKDECCDAVWFSNGIPDVLFQAAGLAGGEAPNVSPNLDDDYRSNSENFFNPFEQTGISLEYSNDFGFADFTYIGSYRDYFANSFRNTDYTGLNIFTVGASPEAEATGNFDPQGGTEIITTTHEARLQGLAFEDRLDWLVGLYYSDEKIDSRGSLTLLDQYQPGVSAGQLGSAVDLLTIFAGGASANGDFATNAFEQDGQSFSIFTHNVFEVSDQFNVTVGLRYVEETKDGKFEQLDGQHNACLGTFDTVIAGGVIPAELAPGVSGPGTAVALNCFVFAAPTVANLNALNPITAAPAFAGLTALLPQEFDDTFEDEELVYTLKAGYKFNDDVNVYAGITHGFKSGGFNLDASAAGGGADPRFASEKIDAYEAGLKATILDGRGVFNAAVFHQEMEDFQVLEFTGIRFQTFNVPKAQSTGFEIETQAQLTDSFASSLGVTYTDANYPDDCDTQDPTDPSFNPNSANLCGAPLTNAPEWVAILGGTYETPIANGDANMFVTGSIKHETERRTSTQPTAVGTSTLLAGDIQDANTKVNLRIGVQAPDERWAVELWGNNITDERTKNVTFNIPLRANSRGQFVQDPATYGVTLRTKF